MKNKFFPTIFTYPTLFCVSALLLICPMTGCSTIDGTTIHSSEMPDSIDLYLSRATFQHAYFEQFKIANHKLFAECGKLASGRQFAQYQNLINLEDQQLNEINSLSNKILDFQDKHQLMLDNPGDNNDLFDPGQFILKINKPTNSREIKTTADSVATPSKTSLKLLHDLQEQIRNIVMATAPSNSLCGRRKFID